MSQSTLKQGVTQWRGYTLLLLTLVYTFSVLDRFILGILLPQIKQELLLNDALLGLLTGAAFAIFYASLGLPIARLADRYGRKHIIAVCLAIFSVMTAVCGMANSFLGLFLARVGVGIGEAGTTPAATSILSDLYNKQQRAGALAIVSVGGNIGILIGFVVGGFVAAHYGWRAGFFVIGVPGVILALVLFLTMPEPVRGAVDGLVEDDTKEVPDLRTTLGFLLQQKSFVWILAGLTLMVGLSTTTITWLPSMLTRSHGMAADQVGVTLGLAIGLLGPIGTVLLGGFLANHLSVRDLRWGAWLSAIGALILVPCYVFLSLANSGTMAMAAYFIPAVLGIFFQGPSLALLQSVTPVTMRATSAAIALFVANMIGLGLGPLSVGLLSDGLNASYGVESLRYALLIVPGMAMIASYVYWRGSYFIFEDISKADAISQS